MPCQFCSEQSHTLRDCDSQIGLSLVDDVSTFFSQNKFHIIHQIRYLQVLTKPQLAFINKELHQTFTAPKKTLIFTIIRKYFRDATHSFRFPDITHFDMHLIHGTYSLLHDQIIQGRLPPDPQMMNIRIKSMIDAFYCMRFGVRRDGLSFQQYFEQLDEIALYEPHRIAFYEREIRAAAFEARANGVIANLNTDFISRFDAFTRNMSLSQSNRSQSQHLKKLAFQVEINSDLDQADDCFLCCETKPIAKLGCSHEYCVDCVFGTAKVRTKTFINCAVCRAEVDVIQVVSETVKTELEKNIASV